VDNGVQYSGGGVGDVRRWNREGIGAQLGSVR
jgi:hypothetical protein